MSSVYKVKLKNFTKTCQVVIENTNILCAEIKLPSRILIVSGLIIKAFFLEKCC